MSSGGTCALPHRTYGCVAVHPIALHKDLLGWIPPSRKLVLAPGSAQTVTIEQLANPSGTRPLIVEIPIEGSAQYFTVESRRIAGYDGQVPGPAVLIHRVDPTRSDRRAQVVDPDGNGDPNDTGAMWAWGETFIDPVSGVRISVEAATPTGYLVSAGVVTSAAPDLVVPWVSDPPASARPATRLSVTDTVLNAGLATATAVVVRYYLSPDPARSSGDQRLYGRRNVPALGPGASSTGASSVWVPLGIPPGTYHLLACVDDASAVTEGAEDNNCRAAASTIRIGWRLP
jgi:hypothetical protein